jgi:hypothetical protein
MQAKAESRKRQATDSLKNDIWDRIESKKDSNMENEGQQR